MRTKKFPTCPNDWMNWWERVLRRVGADMFHRTASWADRLAGLAARFNRWWFRRVSMRFERLSAWALYRGRRREERRWKRQATGAGQS